MLEEWKSCEIIELNIQFDHIHLIEKSEIFVTFLLVYVL